MKNSQDEFIPTRQSLITRLKNWDDSEGWQSFFDTYWKLIYSVAVKSGLNEKDAEDIVQETVMSVARQMPGFRSNRAFGSFKTWLLVLARRRIVDHLRKQGRAPRNYSPSRRTRTGASRIVEKLPDPAGDPVAAIWEDEWQKNVLAAAIENVKGKVDAKQFQMFDCYAMRGWPVHEVAKNLQATVGKIYPAKSRVAALIRNEVRRLSANEP